jgi:hypothetical protein
MGYQMIFWTIASRQCAIMGNDGHGDRGEVTGLSNVCTWQGTARKI